jgi:serine/threonine protein kinase
MKIENLVEPSEKEK